MITSSPTKRISAISQDGGESQLASKLVMILLVWQPIGWISYKQSINCRRKKSNTKMSNYRVN